MPNPRRLPALLLLCSAACAPDAGKAAPGADSAAPSSCDPEGAEVSAFVLQRLGFARADGGVSWGSDLDGVASAAGDGTGCGKPDLVDPDGRPGVDNAFAGLLPALEQTEAAAISALLQDAVDAGELLLVVEVAGLDDPLNDSCVAARVGSAEGAPLLGTDGHLLGGQSFSRGAEGPGPWVEGLEVVDGSLRFPAELRVQLQILDAELDALIQGGEVRIDLSPDGAPSWGHFSGGVSVAYFLEEIEKYGIDPAVKELLRGVLPAVADLPGDSGACDQLSMAFEFDAVPAHFYSGEGG